ncbi:MAG: NAD/NADP octopine/nopaline dehydrogenase family protein [Thermodesulfobacteriota bacterium]
MKLAILGAGNGGTAAAADMALAGHQVNLFEFPQFKENIEPIKQSGGIGLVGVGRTGRAKLNKVTTDISEAIHGLEMIVVVMPAFGHKPLAKICAPHLKDGQIIVLSPGSTLGSLEFLYTLRQEKVSPKIKIADVHTLPYAARGANSEVRILLEVKKLWLAAFPASDTPEVLTKFKQLYPASEAGKNILDVGLNNGNPIVHPGPALLNVGRVEYARGEFYHYKEGITPHVANVIQAIDQERLALCRKMGYPAIPTIERMLLTGYGTTKTSLYDAIHTSPVFCGDHPIKGPKSAMDRYYVEDTAYGLVTWSSLGKAINVPTPTIDAVIQLISALHQTDYFAKGDRSLERFGLANISVDQLNCFLETGSLPS